MKGFNPITDLQQNTDQFNVPVGQSTPEIEAIREKLVNTRNKTAELVRVVKDKNKLFKKDIDRVKNLNRRLFRTIPRIPAMRGVASTEFGPNLAQEDKKARLRLDFFRGFRTRSRVPSAVKPPLPILETVLTIIALRFGFGSGLKGVNKIVPLKQGSKVNIKEIQKILEQAIKKKKSSTIVKPNIFRRPKPLQFPGSKPTFKSSQTSKFFDTPFDASKQTVDIDFEVVSRQDDILARVANLLDLRRLRKFSQEKGFLQFSQKADKIPKIPSFVEIKNNIVKNFKINKFGRRINPEDGLFFARRRRPKGVDKELDEFIGQMVREGKVESFIDLYNKSPAAKNNALRDDFEGVFRIVQKVLKTGEFTGDPKSVRATLDAFTDAVYGMIDQGLVPNVKMKTFMDLLDYLDDVVARSTRGGDTFKTLSKKRFRRFESLFENLRREMINPFKDTSNINTKPMSNDIASLNIDTGITNKLIIITDQLPPTTA